MAEPKATQELAIFVDGFEIVGADWWLIDDGYLYVSQEREDTRATLGKVRFTLAVFAPSGWRRVYWRERRSGLPTYSGSWHTG